MQGVLKLIHAFDQTLDDLVGLYLDAEAGMISFAKQVEQGQKQVTATTGLTIENIDKLPFSYGKGDPNDPNSLHLHSVTQGTLKSRNAKGGKNHRLLGQRFISDVYTYWEDSYRSQIAEALGIDRKTLRSDPLGDIRYLRNSIVHHQGIALSDVEKCKVLNWFKEGDLIEITDEQFEVIVVEVRNWLEELGVEHTGSSPQLAGRFGPSGHRHIGP